MLRMWHAHNHTSPNEVLEKRMAILSNSRHEKFSQLVASGIQPAAAYRSLGYSSKGAPQSANKLRKRSDVRGRVDEIRQAGRNQHCRRDRFRSAAGSKPA